MGESGAVLEALSAGKHVVLIGDLSHGALSQEDLFVLEVDCAASRREPLGPLAQARELAEEALGRTLGNTAAAMEAQQLLAGLRQRIFEDQVEQLPAAGMVDSLNRLGRQSRTQAVVVFRDAQRADDESLAELRDALSTAGWLKVPLLVHFRHRPEEGPGAALVELVSESDAGLVVDADGSEERAASRKVTIPEISPRGLRVLRAAAIIGDVFEAELVADLLEMDLLDVLELLQEAADGGAAIADAGDARFRMAPPLRRALENSLLPSLSKAWHTKLARLLSPDDRAESRQRERATANDGATRKPVSRTARPASQPATVITRAVDEELPHAPAPGSADFEGDAPGTFNLGRPPSQEHVQPVSREQARNLADTEGIPELPDSGKPMSPGAHSRDQGNTATGLGVRTPWESVGTDDQVREKRVLSDARAGDHALAAGQVDLAARNYLNAAREAVLAGAYQYALKFTHLALRLIDSRPRSPLRRQIRVQLMAELGRIQWLAAGPSAHFTLEGALQVLKDARELLEPEDPLELRAEVSTLIASVRYDMGDPDSLEEALSELSQTSRALLESGRPVEAARLLNDQAAVWVRIGDPVRANHLLEESRGVFEDYADDNPRAQLELAETEHLIARLTLHVAARPGREHDAFELGVEHARRAAQTYRDLHLPREYARALETLGRLHLRIHELQLAGELLTTAVKEQRRIGDLLGLARSTAALSDVLVAQGEPSRALMMLQQSVRLNLGKGTARGLAENRTALTKLAETAAGNAQLSMRIARLDEELSRAEQLLSRRQSRKRGD